MRAWFQRVSACEGCVLGGEEVVERPDAVVVGLGWVAKVVEDLELRLARSPCSCTRYFTPLFVPAATMNSNSSSKSW